MFLGPEQMSPGATVAELRGQSRARGATGGEICRTVWAGSQMIAGGTGTRGNPRHPSEILLDKYQDWFDRKGR